MTFYSLETCEIFLKKIKNYSANLYFKFGLRSEEHLECFNPEIFSFAVTGSRPYISSVKCPALSDSFRGAETDNERKYLDIIC